MALASFFKFAKRAVSFDKKLAIYTNGVDNAYPETMERLRNNSVTATMASRLMQQYLIGKGFGETFDKIEIGDQKLIEIYEDLVSDETDNRGVAIQFNYDANFEVSDFQIIPFSDCRLGEKDSKDYSGKILVSKKWSDKTKKEDVTVIDVFNPDKKIVEEQIKACRGKDLIDKVRAYKGQILFVNLDRKYFYPLSRIDSVASECDNEYLASTYKNVTLRNGFFGKTLVVTRPLVENNLIEAAESGDKLALGKLKAARSEREDFQKSIKDFIGVEDIGGVMHMEIDFAGEKLEDAIVFKNIESNIDDKMFEYSENSATDKILMAYNNLPKLLVMLKDNSVFGQSGESIRVAKETYWENTMRDRAICLALINAALNLIPEHKEVKLSIVPLLTKEIAADSAAVENQKAQAQLKGSVGGVTALLSIQASVGAGTTTKEAAVKMIEVIYGIDKETADIMLGNPSPAPKTEGNGITG